MKLSVIMPARNEGDEVYKTCASVKAAGADEVIVVDDGSTDGCCATLPDCVTTFIYNPQAKTTSWCRNLGMWAANGDVIIWCDAHIRAVTSLRPMAELALSAGAVVCASVQPLTSEDAAWTYYGGDLLAMPNHVGYDCRYRQERPATRGEPITAVIGACYAIPAEIARETLRGWPRTLSYGYNEQALSLASHILGVPMINDRDTVIRHKFKKRFNYPIRQSTTRVNRYLVHRMLFEPKTWETIWQPAFAAAFPGVHGQAMQEIGESWVTRAHERYQSLRRISDADLFARLQEPVGSARADRRRDGQ